MRNFLIGLLTILFIASAWNVSAQEQDQATETPVPIRTKKRKEYNRKNVFKMNILSLPIKTFNVGYERVITPKVTIQLVGALSDFTYNDTMSSSNNSLPTRYTGFQLQPEVRFYMSERSAPGGFYLAPFIRYRNLKVENQYTTSQYVTDQNGDLVQVDNVYKANWTSIGGGVTFGYQLLLFKQKLALNGFVGSAYYSQIYRYKNGATPKSFPGQVEASSFSIRLGLAVGIAF